MSLPLHLRGTNNGLHPGLYKILGIEEALLQHSVPGQVLIDLRNGLEIDLSSIASFGFAGTVNRQSGAGSAVPSLHSLSNDAALASGDAVRVHADGKINILYRRGANSNTLFVTERCNSLCLMCSQPPREVDDGWRIAELIQLLPLIDKDLAVLGITGGEPTLLGTDLWKLLSAARDFLPATRLHVLTNGRRFADRTFARSFDTLRSHVTWAVPVYADVAHIHDFVVQAEGAFAETINGLHNLAERGHSIEIRTVIHAQTLPRIEQLARFIYWNLSFAEHVALMGIEPMGLARSNMALLEVSPFEAGASITHVVDFLHQAGMHVSIYNLPLCALAPALRPFARKSISDWKNEYAAKCSSCTAKEECCGFFRSSSTAWRDKVANPIGELAA